MSATEGRVKRVSFLYEYLKGNHRVPRRPRRKTRTSGDGIGGGNGKLNTKSKEIGHG